MTLASPAKPARTKSEAVSCEIENNLYTLYSCPANCRSEVTMLFLVNANGNTTVNAFWYRASQTTSYNILGGKNMTSGEYILLTGATLVLEPGDELRVMPTANSTPNIDAMCTVTETFIPVG
jgi:hypothetical protein